MIDLKSLTPEDELIILETGLNSPFWELIQARLSHLAFTSAGAALSKAVGERDWQAGEASGLKRALQFPGNRKRDLKTKIEQKSTSTRD